MTTTTGMHDPQPGETWLVDLPTSARGRLVHATIDRIDADVVYFEAGYESPVAYSRDSVRFVRCDEFHADPVTTIRDGDRVRFESGGNTVEGRVIGIPTVSVTGTIGGGMMINRTAEVTVVLEDAKAEEQW